MSDHPGLSPTGEAANLEEHALRVYPASSALDMLAQQEDTHPILMLNLLRFQPRGDASLYSRYAEIAAPEVIKVGSFVGYFGKTVTGMDPSFGFDDSWDGAALIVYHRRHSFLDLQQNRAYQRAIPYRTAALSRRTLYVLSDDQNLSSANRSISEVDTSRQSLNSNETDVLILDLFSHPSGEKDSARQVLERSLPLLESFGATFELFLLAEIPVLSEQAWSFFTVTRFPSKDSVIKLCSDPAWNAGKSERRKAGIQNMSIVMRGIP